MKQQVPRRRWTWRQTRTGRVADELREKITSGQIGSSEKLPTFNELAKSFGVSRFTIQNVVALLKKEGFIHGVQRSGLFVTSAPPHLHRVGFVYTSAPQKPDWPRFCSLSEECLPHVFKKLPGMNFESYFEVNASTRTQKWSMLLDDIKHRRLAAVVTLLDAVEIYSEEVFKHSKIPIYSIFAPDHHFEINPSITMVNSSYDLFVRKALQRLKSKGCRRLGWLTIPPVRYGLDYFRSEGFEIKPHWLVHLGRTPVDLSFSIVSLLMDQPRGKRPDALMLADENLVPSALQAIKQLNLTPGKDVEIVAHCNWPVRPPEIDTRIHWLGYSINDVLTSAVQLIAASGSAVDSKSMQYRMEPQFFEELGG